VQEITPAKKRERVQKKEMLEKMIFYFLFFGLFRAFSRA